MARTLVHRIVVWGLGITLVACTAPAAGPQGEKGDKGDPGVAGIQGNPGQPGAQGPEGAPGGFGFIADPYLERGVEKWNVDATTTLLKVTNASEIADGGVAPPGGTSYFENLPNTLALVTAKTYVPVNAQRTYEVTGMFRGHSVGAAGAINLMVRYFDADKNLLEGQDWNAAYNQKPGTTWVTYAAKFGAGTANAIPAGAQFMTAGTLLNLDTNTSNNGNSIYQATALAITPTTPPPVAPTALPDPINFAPNQNGCPFASTSSYVYAQQTFTLARKARVDIQAHEMSNTTTSRVLYLRMSGPGFSGTQTMDTAYHGPSSTSAEWFDHRVSYTGMLNAGTYTAQMYVSGITTGGWGCYGGYGRFTINFYEP